MITVKPTDVPAACPRRGGGRLGPSALDRGGGDPRHPRSGTGAGDGGRASDAERPALVGVGAAAISPGTLAADDDLAWAESLLGAVGTVVRVKESLLDAVTGLSGSGPAYVFLVAEALIDAGLLAGLPQRRQRRACPSRPCSAQPRSWLAVTRGPRRCGRPSPLPGAPPPPACGSWSSGGCGPRSSMPWQRPPSGPGSSAADHAQRRQTGERQCARPGAAASGPH